MLINCDITPRDFLLSVLDVGNFVPQILRSIVLCDQPNLRWVLCACIRSTFDLHVVNLVCNSFICL